MSTQTWNPSRYAANAAFVPALGQPVLDLLQPRPGERILDLGCGDGVLTEKLATVGADVVGVDSSPDMFDAARQRGLDARLMDATRLTFDGEFDAVFSNAVLHWIKDDPDAAIAGAYRALRNPGRFVGEMGGHGCVAAVNVAQLIPRPTPLPTGMRGWLATFAHPYCAALPEDQRENFLDEATEILRPVLCDEKDRWTADYMRLRFVAYKR